jgi:hypothetical protein
LDERLNVFALGFKLDGVDVDSKHGCDELLIKLEKLGDKDCRSCNHRKASFAAPTEFKFPMSLA